MEMEKEKVKNNINWRRKFKDSEDEERLHRFSWGIDIASQNKIIKRELDWIENEILRWYDIFYIEIINNKTKSLKEGIGMASRAAGTSTAPKKEVISESNDMMTRFQKLANIKINE